ncbi:glycosyltransferase [Halopseudomonas salegens]|uniref:Alpha 1,4-glycosyltransferase conserved region n=1 Tax=Halopseudomonas salegens TaxID=1434072 RepID=A0A1H2FLY1_9GAMM|nr:glycosyltransferase [Halopseudomonas salegens]SDU08346.1 Alpha 1,4-glycosyltransferase conserved region [Halopseudomonas salegens]
MIEKRLHYCWFGGNTLPPLHRRCIESWKQTNPDFEIMRWDETNTDFDTPFLKYSFKKRQWAFISDYIRMRVVHKFGGVYLDTDMEVIKPLTPLLDSFCFLGEESNGRPNTAIFGATTKHLFTTECMKIIDHRFKTNMPYLIAPEVAIQAIMNMDDTNIKVLPSEYFYPYNPYDIERETKNLMYADITHNTYAIHHWGKSWEMSLYERIKRIAKKKLLTSRADS